jgi:DNA-binding MarR family transcriptional regulator
LRLVQLGGPVIAADLAEQTGLTRASMAIVDKLANAGLIARAQDASDRRRWLLTAVPLATEKVDAIYTSHAERVGRMLAEYSEHDLELVLRFLRTFADELQATAVELAERSGGNDNRRSGGASG